jgi:hypothetical protein
MSIYIVICAFFLIIPTMYFFSRVKLPILRVVDRRPEPETRNPKRHAAVQSSEVVRMRRGTQGFDPRVPDFIRECWRRMRIMHAAFKRSKGANDVAILVKEYEAPTPLYSSSPPRKSSIG